MLHWSKPRLHLFSVIVELCDDLSEVSVLFYLLLLLIYCQVVDPASSLSSCLLVTTDSATVDRQQTLVEAEAARRSRLGVVVLGVGSLVNGTEAAAIATHADSGVVYADSFDHLLATNVDFADLLADKICGM